MSRPELTIRRARLEEAEGIACLLARAYGEFEKSFPWPDLWGEYLADVTDVRTRWGQSQLWVAEWDGEAGGSVDYYPPYRGGYRLRAETLEVLGAEQRARVTFPASWAAFRCLGVDPGNRGHGVGRALVEKVVTLAVADGATDVVLHSLWIMEAARRLYEEMGFRRLPERDLLLPGGSDEPALAFLMPLGG